MPHTTHEELARRIKEKKALFNQGRKLRFKIVEKSGITLERKCQQISTRLVIVILQKIICLLVNNIKQFSTRG